MFGQETAFLKKFLALAMNLPICGIRVVVMAAQIRVQYSVCQGRVIACTNCHVRPAKSSLCFQHQVGRRCWKSGRGKKL